MRGWLSRSPYPKLIPFEAANFHASFVPTKKGNPLSQIDKWDKIQTDKGK
jgi:hypothetical protein